MSNTITNQDDMIDSRDVIARIEELEDLHEDLQADNETLSCDDMEELAILKKLAAEGENSPDWSHGEQLIRESYFTNYIEELINDCYPMPKELESGEWPWRHVTVDYAAAVEEAKTDYMDLDFDGVIYLIRA